MAGVGLKGEGGIKGYTKVASLGGRGDSGAINDKCVCLWILLRVALEPMRWSSFLSLTSLRKCCCVQIFVADKWSRRM